MISFQKIGSSEVVVDYLNEAIAKRLTAGAKVLWLLSGGSLTPIQIETAKRLQSQNVQNLTVSLTDERFGPIGHPDSNWQKLVNAGFSLSGAKFRPVLENKDFASTTADFAAYLKQEFASCDFKIACIGIGADGHTLGVMPGSIGIDSQELVVGYQAADFQRITMTLGSLTNLDEAVVYMVGREKWSLIDQIVDEDIPPNKQPAQVLKTAKKLTIYNDYRGEPSWLHYSNF